MRPLLLCEYNWTQHPVLDDRGEITKVMFASTNHYSTKEFDDGRVSLRAMITLPCGDGYCADLPVFTEWFE